MCNQVYIFLNGLIDLEQRKQAKSKTVTYFERRSTIFHMSVTLICYDLHISYSHWIVRVELWPLVGMEESLTLADAQARTLSGIWCLYIFEINPLSVASFAIIFSQSEGCLFTLLIVSFVVQKLLSFIRSHLFIFAFVSNILGCGS